MHNVQSLANEILRKFTNEGPKAYNGAPVRQNQQYTMFSFKQRKWIEAKLTGLLEEAKKPYIAAGAAVLKQGVMVDAQQKELARVVADLLWKAGVADEDMPPHHEMCADGLGGCHPDCPNDRGIPDGPHVREQGHLAPYPYARDNHRGRSGPYPDEFLGIDHRGPQT